MLQFLIKFKLLFVKLTKGIRMKLYKRLRIIFTAILFLNILVIVSGCGSGGGNSNNSQPQNATITSPAQSLTGTYKLSGFDIYYDNGSKISHNEVQSYSGTWVLRTDLTTSQSLEINGQKFTTSGTWKIDASTGQLIFATSGYEVIANISISGNVVSTDAYVASYGYREIDYWTKVSDSTAKTVAIANKTIDDDNYTDSLIGIIAGKIMEDE